MKLFWAAALAVTPAAAAASAVAAVAGK